MKTIIHTKSGSTYVVTEKEGTHTISAANVPNQHTPAMEGEHVLVSTPVWPPVEGANFFFYAPTFSGSMKVTNLVVSVETEP